jgi:polyisoprenoid-binding protein YceI
VTIDGIASAVRVGPAAGTWVADPAATTASFTARNFGVRHVVGTVTVTAAQVTVDRTGRPVDVRAVADLTTVTTGSARRDTDLTGRRFFDVEHHPELLLVAHRVEAAENGWRVLGSLSVRGVAAPLDLDVRVEAPPADPAAPWRIVATGTFDLRTTPIRAPRALVGRYVAVRIETTLVLQAP